MLSAVLDRTVTDAALGLVWTAVTCADLQDNALPADEAESVIDVVRTHDSAQVAVVFKEAEEGVWTVSARSRGAADVGALCVALGGGGHRLAAGYTAYGSLETVVAQLRSALATATGE
jgi:phosphoesterase RecJ-like protein